MNQVLVTGAGGFVGSHVCEALVAAGWQVQALVHTESGLGWLEDLPEAVLKELQIFRGDIRDAESMRQWVKSQSLIIHLAALTRGFSAQHSREYIDTNVTGTLNLLHAALAHDCRVIHTSTAEVYGDPLYLPVDEKHPLQGRSPFVASKIAADMLAESFFRSFHLNLNVVRLFPLFGPRQHSSALLPWLFERLTDPACSAISLPLLTARLDLSPIANAVSAFLALVSHTHLPGEVIHFGAGQETSVESLAHTLMAKLGIHKPLVLGESPGLDCFLREHLCPNLTKARSQLHWQPLQSLEQGLDETLAWLQARKQVAP